MVEIEGIQLVTSHPGRRIFRLGLTILMTVVGVLTLRFSLRATREILQRRGQVEKVVEETEQEH